MAFLSGDTHAVPHHHAYGDYCEDTGADVFEAVHALVDDPSEERGGEVEGTALKALRDVGGLVARLFEYGVSGLGEGRSHVGNEVEADGQGHETDDEGLHHVALSERQHHGEEVEHTGERSKRQELVAGKDDRQAQGHGDEQQRHDERRGMADDHGGRHADIDFLAIELLLHHLLRLLGDGRAGPAHQSAHPR